MKVFIFFCMMALTLVANNFEKSLNIVTDTTTNTMWQDNLESTQYLENVTMAKIYCESLILNGYTDWEMATIKKLQTIIDISNKDFTIPKEFQYTTATKYWSKSEYSLNKDSFWYVDFKTGIVNFDRSNKRHTVRCIREIK